ncbi:ABC transporter substrate-binding protein [Candidatus Poriferisodalis sp.]|uniref:urea ABC transporter substrate-binding protein n=1 Tax=Candidatus Poriferisodalis sp. TaxID=3101277 RepID=UPI003B018810
MSANASVAGCRARSHLYRLTVALIALGLTLAACASSDDAADPAADTAAAIEAGTADTAAEATETTTADLADDEAAAPVETEPIRVGSLLDETGPLNIYGTPMADATRLAIADINAKGGVLGRQLELVALDSKSDQNEYITGADQLVAQDLAVVHAGITSASREAIRPIFDEAELLYFYNVLYEGGVCDRNTFVTGVVPTQQLQVLIPWAIENMGPRLYVLAADYNYGQISADWVREYAAANGGEIVGEDFFPLDVAEFGTTISEVQDASPDAVVSLLVGGAHMSFYSQYAAAGVNADIPIVSTTFGLGSEQVALDGASSEGIVVAYPYFEELDTAVNTEFVAAWQNEFGSDYPYITDLAVYVWEGWHLWADAVNAAGTLDRDAVIAQLESGVSFGSPKGEVSMDGGSHHLIQPVSLARANASNGFDVFETFDNIPPSFEQDVCDLIASPDTNEQFTP